MVAQNCVVMFQYPCVPVSICVLTHAHKPGASFMKHTYDIVAGGNLSKMLYHYLR